LGNSLDPAPAQRKYKMYLDHLTGQKIKKQISEKMKTF
jgi:hypothetical protein